MELVCRKCGGIEFIQIDTENIHKHKVNCAYCDSFVRWGTIEGKKKVEDGEYIATILSAEEKKKTTGENFILMILEIEEKGKLTHFIWKSKDTNKYNQSAICSMINGFECNLSDFNSVNGLLSFLAGKKTKIKVNKERIISWSKILS